MPTSSGHTRAICAKKVIGADIKDAAGNKIGQVEDIVLDKLSNEVMFAVAGFGGFLGIGEKYHPLPWSLLDYDSADDSYVCNVTKDTLQSAPADSIEALVVNDGAGWRDRTYAHHGVTA
jgi:hypothetical protein